MKSRVVKIGLLFLLPFQVCANTIIVAPHTNVATLKQALTLAKNGDSIIVKKGTYASINTVIDKELTILGENHPILDAHFTEEVITITASHVKLDGFIIKNSKTGSMRDFAGIRLSNVEYVTISNNILVDNFFGIYLSNCLHIQLLHNLITGSANIENSGNGIHLWKCKEVLIKENYVTRHRDGIYFEFAKKCLIEDNLSEKNIRYGLHFMFSDDDTYRHNTFKNNGSGVSVMYTRRIAMLDNTFIENWGSSIYGVLLKEITDARIEGNHFIRNTTGIYMENSDRITVTHNDFISNGWAMRVLASCNKDHFTQNNYKGNSFDVTTNGTLKEIYFSNNYWDKYDGYDLNKDGVGDIPYRPISLYAQIIEQNPQSVMLMRSFIVNLIDKVERAIPSITPESVKDDKPAMKPWKK
ncbi:nitrous oxide reductase family maturation protein NosD [Mucilaginibacter flavidus]|uniref:nitrous oxide reductase family maturation protein NosD n=1 Tax=Mucilaginibacter flavidus TaxID=2949309 RepID=UPI00209223AB|nr:nitrous oxide reductase family maturation protein NosD [Mucilaginibacter flavidus]MCO5948198.1 nitrous oxide reductase family maturation protein NosD [Mucilaginibacter flavidus]